MSRSERDQPINLPQPYVTIVVSLSFALTGHFTPALIFAVCIYSLLSMLAVPLHTLVPLTLYLYSTLCILK